MSTSMETLGKVVEQALQRRDQALAELARLQRELAQAQDQMDQLQAYTQEAQQRWAARCAVGVDATLLMHHRQFMARIEHAVDFQRRVLDDRQALLGRGQAALHEAERDLAGLRKFTERRQQAIDQRALRREQKHNDEMALNIHRRHAGTDSRFGAITP